MHERGGCRGGRFGGPVRMEAMPWLRSSRRTLNRVLPHDVPVQAPVLLPVHRTVEDLHMQPVGREQTSRCSRG